MRARVWRTRVTIMCPGCKGEHDVTTAEGGWSFNGDVDRPTLSPSLLLRSGHYASAWKQGENCWCTYNAENPDERSGFTCTVCHSFVRDGRIQFLTDSTHNLAGQTVDLPELND